VGPEEVARNTLTGKPPADGYTPAAVALRALLDAVTEQAITYDLYAGPGLAAVAAALGVTERTARPLLHRAARLAAAHCARRGLRSSGRRSLPTRKVRASPWCPASEAPGPGRHEGRGRCAVALRASPRAACGAARSTAPGHHPPANRPARERSPLHVHHRPQL
jgi:hypothetical protein